MSFIKIQYVIFSISMAVSLGKPIESSEIGVATSKENASQKHDVQIDTAKLTGLSRKKAHELLGQPKHSEELFPYSKHCTIVDYYGIKIANVEHLRITYDKDNIVSAAEVEPPLPAIPKFMGQKAKTINLTDTKLRDFLNNMPEDKLRSMSADQISKKLGKPDRSWHEASRAGGRDWHFLNLLYYLTENGRTAFILTFDEASNSVYEYRLQSIYD